MQQKIIILDFGSQTTQLIGRRLRDLDTFCEILPYNKFPYDDPSIIGVILSGSPYSVYDPEAFKIDLTGIRGKYPILGICYGAQFMAHTGGGKVEPAGSREYGRANLQSFEKENPLFKGFSEHSQVWMSHGDTITALPEGFRCIASTDKVKFAAYQADNEQLWGVQFHPEAFHSEQGTLLLKNFAVDICGSRQDWSPASFVDSTVAQLKQELGNDRVILGLSGGVDSSVAAALLSKAVGKQLTCVFVDQGLMRKDEGDMVESTFTGLFDMNFVRINCQQHFYDRLKGVSDPEQKRKIIGAEFYRVFWDRIRQSYGDGFFAQGTIYPDRIESGKGSAAVIKTHHNQVKQPDDIKFLGTIEPLKDLFKDEVRRVGEMLGLPHELVWRQPFPGPGLGVRIIGEITPERVHILQEADAVLRDEMEKCGYDKEMSQFFAVLPGVKTVGVMGDGRTYDELIAIRAVTTVDFMTADWAHIPYDILGRVSNRIINEVPHVNRVVYDITSKPPGTVEWE